MTPEWHDIVGGIGALLMLSTYFLLQVDMISAQSLKYSILNALGSGGVVISLTQAFNMSAFIIEGCWLIISIIGIGVTLLRWRKAGKQMPGTPPAP